MSEVRRLNWGSGSDRVANWINAGLADSSGRSAWRDGGWLRSRPFQPPLAARNDPERLPPAASYESRTSGEQDALLPVSKIFVMRTAPPPALRTPATFDYDTGSIGRLDWNSSGVT
jgi:hypothetical protein